MEGSALWSQSDYDEREEFARNVKISLLGVTPSGVGSFQPSESSIADDWEQWSEQIFGAMIGPIFRDTLNLAIELKLREIIEFDRVLGDLLGEPHSAKLIAASQPFIEGKEKMRGHLEWRKYVLKLQSGEAPGHLPIMFALHAVLFRMPLASALLAYAWYEWKLGHFAIGKSAHSGHAEDPPASFLIVKSQISQLLNPSADDQENGGLRVV